MFFFQNAVEIIVSKQATLAASLSSFPSNYFSDAGGNHHPTAASTTNMPAQAPPQE
jgi:hypothetical protein